MGISEHFGTERYAFSVPKLSDISLKYITYKNINIFWSIGIDEFWSGGIKIF